MLNYQMESSHVADYDLYTLPGVPFTMRGPAAAPEGRADSISFIGQAQTFGAFCQYPFPNLLGAMCSAQVFNFGRGGAGPGYFRDQEAIIDYVNNSSCCVLQMMSARSSVENEYFSSVNGLASVEFKKGPRKGEKMLGHRAYDVLATELSVGEFTDLVKSTREHYLSQFKELIDKIEVPKVLLYIGRRRPLRNWSLKARIRPKALIGLHPHMVTEGMVAEIGSQCDEVVTVYGDEGVRHRLLNRFDGNYTTIRRAEDRWIKDHSTYISPYLHVEAAMKLYGPVKRLMKNDG